MNITKVLVLAAIVLGASQVAPRSHAEDRPAVSAANTRAPKRAAQTRGPASELRSLTRAGARIAIEAAVREAERRGVGLAISVVDAGGHLLAAERVDHTFVASAHVSEGKARTAVAFGRPTGFFEKVIRDGRTPMVALDDFTPLQGGVPVELDGQILGGIGASGASSAAEDEELAMIAQKAVLAALGQRP